MIKPSLAALVAAATLAAAPTARAQETAATNAKEFGLDAGVRFGFGDLNSTIIALPAQSFRVGFYRSPTVSIEPYGAFNYRKIDEGDGTTQLALGTGLLYHFASDRRASAYVRPFAEVSYLNAGDASDTQFTVGGGLGFKRPWSDRFAWRLEGNLGYTLESGDLPGGLSLGLSAGMSFFTF